MVRMTPNCRFYVASLVLHTASAINNEDPREIRVLIEDLIECVTGNPLKGTFRVGE
jgi:hypothetical protein